MRKLVRYLTHYLPYPVFLLCVISMVASILHPEIIKRGRYGQYVNNSEPVAYSLIAFMVIGSGWCAYSALRRDIRLWRMKKNGKD